MSRSAAVKSNPFDEMSRFLQGIHAEDIRPLGDRVVIRHIPEPDREGSLYLPEKSRDGQHIREGVVIGIGPGDKYFEEAVNSKQFNAEGRVQVEREAVVNTAGVERLPMECRFGMGFDGKVLYSRREDELFYIDGQEYFVVHEEQAVLAKFIWEPYEPGDKTYVERKLPVPLRDRILVERVEPESKTRGGLYIPDNAQDKPQEGKVLAVGAGRFLRDGRRAPMDVKVGDTVLFGKYVGSEVKIGGRELVIMFESAVLGVRG